jgi:hypothetical protein
MNERDPATGNPNNLPTGIWFQNEQPFAVC